METDMETNTNSPAPPERSKFEAIQARMEWIATDGGERCEFEVDDERGDVASIMRFDDGSFAWYASNVYLGVTLATGAAASMEQAKQAVAQHLLSQEI